jgi:hypothetical protein
LAGPLFVVQDNVGAPVFFRQPLDFRPENDPFTRLGLRAKTGLFPTFPETPSPSKLKSKLKNSGFQKVPRKYYCEVKM